jgi:hypothetical protein
MAAWTDAGQLASDPPSPLLTVNVWSQQLWATLGVVPTLPPSPLHSVKVWAQQLWVTSGVKMAAAGETTPTTNFRWG